MSIWAFLGGAADAGERMLEDSRKQQLMQMQQEAEQKRQAALAQLQADNQLRNETEITKLKDKLAEGDFKYVHPQPDGGLIAVKKDNSVVELRAGNPKYIENQNALAEARLANMQAHAESAMANAGRAGDRLEFLKQQAEQRAAAEKEKAAREAEMKKTALYESASKAVQNEWDKDYNNIGKTLDPEELDARTTARLNQASAYAKGGGMNGPTGIAPAVAVPNPNSMVPGASPAMPLPVKPGDPRPPSGTYVIDTVTGKTGRVP